MKKSGAYYHDHIAWEMMKENRVYFTFTVQAMATAAAETAPAFALLFLLFEQNWIRRFWFCKTSNLAQKHITKFDLHMTWYKLKTW